MIDGRALRARMVNALAAAGRIRSPRVAAAFQAVPRAMFVPHVDLPRAYQDEAIVTRWDGDGRPLSSSSQPTIMAIMLEQLGVEPGHRVLEIGAGTGYNAALLGHLVGPTGHVVSLDIDQDVTQEAREHLDRAGIANVEVIAADGADGWQPAAPYDRIILTASTRDIAPAWVAQLVDEGRIVVPLSLRGMQCSVALQHAGRHLSSTSIVGCGFMPLRGSFAGADASRPLGVPGAFVVAEGNRVADPASLRAALASPGPPIAAQHMEVADAEIMGGLGLWIMLHDPDAALLTAVGSAVETQLLPVSLPFPGMTIAVAVLGDHGLATLARPRQESPTAGNLGLVVQPFGSHAEEPVRRLLAHVKDWAANGRLSTADLTIRVYPRPEAGCVDSGSAPVIDLPHTRLVLDFANPTGRTI